MMHIPAVYHLVDCHLSVLRLEPFAAADFGVSRSGQVSAHRLSTQLGGSDRAGKLAVTDAAARSKCTGVGVVTKQAMVEVVGVHGAIGQLARAPSTTPRRRVKARPSAIMPTPSTR